MFSSADALEISGAVGLALHPFAVATALVEPSAISHWSALSHHGLTTQVPRVVTCMTARKVVTPSMRGRLPRQDQGRHRWETAAGLRVTYTTVTPARYFGVEDVWVDERFRVPITDRERTVLETFAHPAAFGGIGEAFVIVEEHEGDLDLARLVRHAQRYGAASVARRLGIALERAGVPPEALEPLRTVPAAGVSLLDPSGPTRGRIDVRWAIQDNLTPRRWRPSSAASSPSAGHPASPSRRSRRTWRSAHSSRRRRRRGAGPRPRGGRRHLGAEGPFASTLEPLRVRDKHPGGQDAFGIALELHRSEGTVR